MSMVPDVLVARQMGMRVLGLSIVLPEYPWAGGCGRRHRRRAGSRTKTHTPHDSNCGATLNFTFNR